MQQQRHSSSTPQIGSLKNQFGHINARDMSIFPKSRKILKQDFSVLNKEFNKRNTMH
jgi:hypothetical protein